MQQVNELLEFNIDTPSDIELAKIFEREIAEFHERMQDINDRYNSPKQEISISTTTRNQKKRARRKARANS